jgi:hypothetical protein
VVKRLWGQRSFLLRSLTVTITLLDWKSTSVTLIPGRSIRRLNTVVVRTSALPGSVVFFNSKPNEASLGGYSGEFGQLFRSFRTPRGAVGGRVATDVCVSG